MWPNNSLAMIVLLLFVLLHYSTTTKPLLSVHNLLDNPIVVVSLGDARVQSGYLKFNYPINLNDYRFNINEIHEFLQTMNKTSPLYAVISLKETKLKDSFAKLAPRRTRRAEAGLWKWLAGSPDTDDVPSLKSLQRNNEKNVQINRILEERVRNLTRSTQLSSSLTAYQREMLKDLVLASKIDSLQYELDLLEETIIKAKQGTAITRLLSYKEIEMMMSTLESQNASMTHEELMALSKAQVKMNQDEIVYTVKVPKMSKLIYEYINIDPLIWNSKRIVLGSNLYVRGGDALWEVRFPCESKDNHYLCDESLLNPVSGCLDDLINGRNANCTTEMSKSSVIKRINDETILINNAKAQLVSNCFQVNRTLVGSYLIQFANCYIWINKQGYGNNETIVIKRPYIPSFGLTVKQINMLDLKPTAYVDHLEIEHRKMVEQYDLEASQQSETPWRYAGNIVGVVAGAMTMVGGVVLGIMRLKKTTGKGVTVTLNNQPYHTIPLKTQVDSL